MGRPRCPTTTGVLSPVPSVASYHKQRLSAKLKSEAENGGGRSGSKGNGEMGRGKSQGRGKGKGQERGKG